MSDLIHPARQIPFTALMAGLERARGLGFVHRRVNAAAGLQLFIYTPRCVYDDGWDEFTVMARGLILDEAAGQVVATPFPKFFNVGERRGDVPDHLAAVLRHGGFRHRPLSSLGSPYTGWRSWLRACLGFARGFTGLALDGITAVRLAMSSRAMCRPTRWDVCLRTPHPESRIVTEPPFTGRSPLALSA